MVPIVESNGAPVDGLTAGYIRRQTAGIAWLVSDDGLEDEAWILKLVVSLCLADISEFLAHPKSTENN